MDEIDRYELLLDAEHEARREAEYRATGYWEDDIEREHESDV